MISVVMAMKPKRLKVHHMPDSERDPTMPDGAIQLNWDAAGIFAHMPAPSSLPALIGLRHEFD
jgi:hypothetical protein